MASSTVKFVVIPSQGDPRDCTDESARKHLGEGLMLSNTLAAFVAEDPERQLPVNQWIADNLQGDAAGILANITGDVAILASNEDDGEQVPYGVGDLANLKDLLAKDMQKRREFYATMGAGFL